MQTQDPFGYSELPITIYSRKSWPGTLVPSDGGNKLNTCVNKLAAILNGSDPYLCGDTGLLTGGTMNRVKNKFLIATLKDQKMPEPHKQLYTKNTRHVLQVNDVMPIFSVHYCLKFEYPCIRIKPL